MFAANVVLREDVQEEADVEASMAALREDVQEEADVESSTAAVNSSNNKR